MYSKRVRSIFIVFSVVFIITTMADSQLSIQDQWKDFKETHNKDYGTPEEEQKRYKIFEENVKGIEQHNQNYETGEVTYKMGINKFADLTQEEFEKYYPGGLLLRPDATTAV